MKKYRGADRKEDEAYLSSIIALVDNQILGLVVILAREVDVDDTLNARGVALLRVKRRSGHVWHHGISTTEGVLSVAKRMVFWSRLRIPNVATVATEMPALQGLRDVFLHHDSAACRVDEP
jgi:hypothetical protein